MKSIIAILLLLLAPAACAARNATGDLYLLVTMTRGERSKDSHSTTKTIKLVGNQLIYEETYQGRGAKGREPIRKVFAIKPKEVEPLRNIITQKGLLNPASKEFAGEGGFTYFDISIKLRMNGKDSLIQLNGSPRHNRIKEDALYQNAEALMREVFNLLHQHDDSIEYQGMLE